MAGFDLTLQYHLVVDAKLLITKVSRLTYVFSLSLIMGLIWRKGLELGKRLKLLRKSKAKVAKQGEKKITNQPTHSFLTANFKSFLGLPMGIMVGMD